MILSLALAVAVIGGGTIATYAYDRRGPFLLRVLTGLCTGLAALGLIGFVLASRFGLTELVIVVAGAIVAAPATLLLSNPIRSALSTDLKAAPRDGPVRTWSARRETIVRAALFVSGVILLWCIADRTMFVRPDGIYTGVSHNLGDLPFHLSVMNRFVYGDNFPPEHPSYAGVSFTYPFLTDFIGAMFVLAGMPARDVIVWSTLLFCVTIAALFYWWTFDLTGDRDAAFIAPALALVNGGVGWWRLFGEAASNEGGIWSLLARLPHDYTITYDNEFRWGNLVTTLLVTQRGLLLGLPLALIVFRNWWRAIATSDEGSPERSRLMIAAGLIAGLLPLIHAHTYAVVVGMAVCLAVLFRDRRLWVPFFAVSLALGLPQVWWVAQASGVRSGSFVAWSVGWDHGDQNVVLFWLKNTGLLIPLIVAAICWRGSRPLLSRPLLVFYLPFTLCFVIPNLFRLAPWIWDNIKILTYWFVASVPIVGLLLARLAQGNVWRRALATTLFVSLTLAGTLDLWRVASRGFEARIFDRAGIEFAAIVCRKTPPSSLILHAPAPNHPVVLTGRRSLMGYPGHVWSHGLDPGPREADIRRIFAGGPDAATLLGRYGIEYVVVGPLERSGLSANEHFFAQYPRIGESAGYRLYRTRDVRE